MWSESCVQTFKNNMSANDYEQHQHLAVKLREGHNYRHKELKKN